MRLFRVDFQHNMRPPLLVRGVTRAQITRQMKERYGDLFLRVDYISHEDAEAQFGHFDLFKEGINIKKADMGDVIDDFYKSDAPQFKGRSKAKRRQMAIAAKLNSEDNKYTNEEDFSMIDNDAKFITPESELTEEVYFKVQVSGLPDMYMTASSAGMIKAKLRKMLKNMDMIKDIVKTTKPEVRKAFRMKAMEGEESVDENLIEKKGGEPDKKISPNTRALAKASDNRSRSTVIKAMNQNAPKDAAIAGRSYQEDKEDVNEISKSTLSSYVKKADVDKSKQYARSDLGMVSKDDAYKNQVKRNKGIDMAKAKMNSTKVTASEDKDDKDFAKLSPEAQTHANAEMRKGASGKDAIARAKKQYNEDLVDNKTRFGKPTEEVFEQEVKHDEVKLVNFTSILTGENPFYLPIKEGHDEIQDKNVDGLDDNQKPEGHKTAKQFPPPKEAKKKMKQLKMEMKTDVADFVLEKAKLQKRDMKMRAGKLDPKAMAALKTMSQDEAKVLVQGLPANLRRSTMKELGIKEKTSLLNSVDLLFAKKNKTDEVEEASMQQQQDQATKTYNDNKKSLQSLHRKSKSQGGQVHVDYKDEKGKTRSGRYNGMMKMGAHTYAKIEPHSGRGSMTALPIHHATNIRHVK